MYEYFLNFGGIYHDLLISKHTLITVVLCIVLHVVQPHPLVAHVTNSAHIDHVISYTPFLQAS